MRHLSLLIAFVAATAEVACGASSGSCDGAPLALRSGFGIADYAVLVGYLAVLVAMGAYFSRRERTTSDYFLAGRRVPWWAAGLSIFGTQVSVITFLAIPAKVYATDWTYLLAYATIPAVAPLVVYVYLPFFRRLNVTTAYEYLEKRFNLAARLFGSTAFILLQLARMGIILCLPAIALSTVADVSVWACVLIVGVLCTTYTVMGGIEAVVWTDVLQVIVLMGGALLSLGIVVANVDGGASEVLTIAQTDGKLRIFNWSWDHTVATVWVIFIGNLFVTLGPYTTDQAVVQRYLTTRDEKQAAGAIWTNALMTVPSAAVFFALGTALYVFYKLHPDLLGGSSPADSIFPWFIVTQLPAGIAGLVVAGLLAAAMSSVDSSMNSIATALVTDFYQRLRPTVADHRRLNAARWITALAGVFGTATAWLIASLEIVSLWDLFVEILGMLTGSLAGLFALGIFTRRANGIGGLIGVAVSLIALVLVRQFTDLHFFMYALVAVGTCLIIGYSTSVALRAPCLPLQGLTIYTVQGRRESSALPGTGPET